jgi:hypothetical protein
MAKVFISHRLVDTTEAARLAADLRRLGHQVWLDADEVRPGDSIVQKIDEGLANADYLVLCYSSAGVASPWTSREWMSTLSRQLNGVGVRLIPIRLTGGQAPAILDDIKYADLAKDWQTGLSELASALR